jgi:hypothetical protein
MGSFKVSCPLTHANPIRKCIVRHCEPNTPIIGYAGWEILI